MIRTFVSSRIDRLIAHFNEHLFDRISSGDPLLSALESRRDPIVIYPNSAVRDLLMRTTADHNGVAAGIEWAAPANIISRATNGISDKEVFGAQAVWMIYRLLDSLRESSADDDFAVLQKYSGRTDRDLFDLSKRIQTLLAAYAVYRPDWILAWAAGREANAPKIAGSPHVVWQKKLVQCLAEDGLCTDWIRRAEEELSTCGKYWRNRHVILFAPLSVSPRLERFLRTVSESGANVSVYLPGAEQAPSDPDGVMSLYLQHAESLKSRFQTMGSIEVLEGDLCEGTLLEALQKHAAGFNVSFKERLDESFCVIRASSLTRELETFSDRLQMLFQEDPTLTPGDVQLLFPDIDAAVPSLHSVFGRLRLHEKSSSPMVLPLRITGTARPAGDTLADGLPTLMRLVVGECDREDFIAWLMHPAVMKGFGLSLDDVGLVDGWLRAAGFAAGINSCHLHAVEHADRLDDRTLAAAAERLTAFYALGDVKRLPIAEDVLPTSGLEAGEWDTVTERPELLHTLCMVSECLSVLAAAAYNEDGTVRLPVSAGQLNWKDTIIPVVASLFPEADANEWTALNGLFAESGRNSTFSDGKPLSLSLELLTLAFEDMLRLRSSVSRNSDVITAGPVKTLFGFPKRVTAIFGLKNGCGFCEEKILDEFDLRKLDDERQGDRNAAAEDRYRFVTTMLSASDILHLSYTGSSIKGGVDNPSVVVKDMLSAAEETGTLMKIVDESVSSLLPRAFMTKAENPDAPARSWKSTDARLARLFDAEGEVHQPTRVSPIPDLGRTPEGYTNFRTMKEWLMKPAAVILRALRLPYSSFEAETADKTELTDNSALSEYLRRTKLLEAARSGFSDDDLISVWLSDPMIGVKKLRRAVVEKDIQAVRTIIAAAMCFRAEEEGKGAVRTAVRLTVPLGPVPEQTVVHVIDEVWISNSQAVIFSESVSKAPVRTCSPLKRGHAGLYDLLALQAAFECGTVDPVNPAAASATAALAERIRSASGSKLTAREKSPVSVVFCSPAKDPLVQKGFTFCPPKVKTYPAEHPDAESLFEAVSARRLLKAYLDLFLYARMHPDQLVYDDQFQLEASERLSPDRPADPRVLLAVSGVFESIPASNGIVGDRDSAVASVRRLLSDRD